MIINCGIRVFVYWFNWEINENDLRCFWVVKKIELEGMIGNKWEISFGSLGILKYGIWKLDLEFGIWFLDFMF